MSVLSLPDTRRAPYYRPFSQLLRSHFPFPVFKVTIDAAMTCPNIDGTVAEGGCTYCDNTSFSPALREGDPMIRRQIDSSASFYRERFGAQNFLAYFQTFSNTYAPVEKLRKMYDRAMGHPQVVGMSIGTRPDCVDAEKLRLIAEYKRQDPRRLVCIEYGMQTVHDETARRINRGHDHQATIDAMRLTREVTPELHVCLHLIIGLPGETPEMIRQSAEAAAALRPDSVKIHHCYVYENTKLAEDWRRGEYRALELAEYVGLAADMLERLPPSTYIQRLTGEISSSGVLAPHWGRKKLQVINAISDELARRGSHQGALYRAPETAPQPVAPFRRKGIGA